MNRPWPSHLTSLSLALSIGKISVLAALSPSEHCCETKRCDVKSTWQTMKHWTNKWYYHSLTSQVSDIMLTNKVTVISFGIHLSKSYFSQLDSCGMIGAKIYTKRKSLNLSFRNSMIWYYAVSGAPHCLLGLRRLWRGADCSESLASGLSSLSCTICYPAACTVPLKELHLTTEKKKKVLRVLNTDEPNHST